jgi:hypothetical protein
MQPGNYELRGPDKADANYAAANSATSAIAMPLVRDWRAFLDPSNWNGIKCRQAEWTRPPGLPVDS